MQEMLTFALTHQAGLNAELSELSLSSDSYHHNRESESVNQHAEASLHTVLCVKLQLLHPQRRFMLEELLRQLRAEAPTV